MTLRQTSPPTRRRRKPKTLLIKYHENMNQQPMSPRANDRLGIYPPLGIASVGAYLRSHGYPVELLDIQVLNIAPDRIHERIARADPDVVGITVKTLGLAAALQVARESKRALPHVPVVLGGPHCSLFAPETLHHDCVDACVDGDGEETMLDLVRRLHEGLPWDDVPGTVLRVDGEVKVNTARPPVGDLDSLPFAALDLLPIPRYRSMTIDSPFTTLISSRGCPYKCGFCSQVYTGRYRWRSVTHVVDEMEDHLHRFGAKEIVMFDETFTLNRRRCLAICREIHDRGLRFSFNVRTRVDCVDREMLEALSAAGCKALHLGVESGSQRILDQMEKEVTVDQIREAFRLGRELGFETRAYFMVGYLDEDAESMDATLRLALELPLDWVSFSVACPLPGTPLYDEARRRRYISQDFWGDYTRAGGTLKVPHLSTERFSATDLLGRQHHNYRSFYLRPPYLARKVAGLTSSRNLRDLYNGFHMLLALG